MRKILKIKPIEQLPAMCGPTSLKIVLDYFEKKVPLKKLIKLTKANHSSGTKPENLVSAAKKLGFEVVAQKNSSIYEIKKFLLKNLPVIVDWFSRDEGHYSVVVGIDKNWLWLADPEFGKIKKIRKEVFERVWFDFPGKKIRKSSDLLLRWLMVVKPK